MNRIRIFEKASEGRHIRVMAEGLGSAPDAGKSMEKLINSSLQHLAMGLKLVLLCGRVTHALT